MPDNGLEEEDRVPRREEKQLFLVFPEKLDMSGVDIVDSESMQELSAADRESDEEEVAAAA